MIFEPVRVGAVAPVVGGPDGDVVDERVDDGLLAIDAELGPADSQCGAVVEPAKDDHPVGRASRRARASISARSADVMRRCCSRDIRSWTRSSSASATWARLRAILSTASAWGSPVSG